MQHFRPQRGGTNATLPPARGGTNAALMLQGGVRNNTSRVRKVKEGYDY